MLASLLLLTALPTASAGVEITLDDALEMGLSVLYGEASSTRCDGYMEDEYGNIHQTFVTEFFVDEIQEGDAVVVYPNEAVLEVVWHRTEWVGEEMMSCGSMLGELGSGWVGALVVEQQSGTWYADSSITPEVEVQGDALPLCGPGEEEPSDDVDPTDADEGDDIGSVDADADGADGSGKAASAGCTQVASGGVSGWLAGLFALGLLLRRRDWIR